MVTSLLTIYGESEQLTISSWPSLDPPIITDNGFQKAWPGGKYCQQTPNPDNTIRDGSLI